MATRSDRAIRLVEPIAERQRGFITTADAAAVGVTAADLWRLANAGGLRHCGRFVYRLADATSAPSDRLFRALLLVGDGAMLAGPTVLAEHGGFVGWQARVWVATAVRTRRTFGERIEVVRCAPDAPYELVDGIRSQPVADAILSSRTWFETKKLIRITRAAALRGLISPDDKERVMYALDRHSRA